jgi:hypothetical protein
MTFRQPTPLTEPFKSFATYLEQVEGKASSTARNYALGAMKLVRDGFPERVTIAHAEQHQWHWLAFQRFAQRVSPTGRPFDLPWLPMEHWALHLLPGTGSGKTKTGLVVLAGEFGHLQVWCAECDKANSPDCERSLDGSDMVLARLLAADVLNTHVWHMGDDDQAPPCARRLRGGSRFVHLLWATQPRIQSWEQELQARLGRKQRRTDLIRKWNIEALRAEGLLPARGGGGCSCGYRNAGGWDGPGCPVCDD